MFLFFSGAGTETGPVRQRFSNSTRRDSQLYQISFVDGRIGSVHVERAAHHPHRIPVSFIPPPLCCCCCCADGSIVSASPVIFLVGWGGCLVFYRWRIDLSASLKLSNWKSSSTESLSLRSLGVSVALTLDCLSLLLLLLVDSSIVHCVSVWYFMIAMETVLPLAPLYTQQPPSRIDAPFF